MNKKTSMKPSKNQEIAICLEKLYNRFAFTDNNLSLDSVKSICDSQEFDNKGEFIKTSIGKLDTTYCAMLLFIAGITNIIKHNNSDEFIGIINSHYKMKRLVLAKYPSNDIFIDMFDYIKILVTYGIKTMSHQPAAIKVPENEWELIDI